MSLPPANIALLLSSLPTHHLELLTPLIASLGGPTSTTTWHPAYEDILHRYWYPLKNAAISKSITCANGTSLAIGVISRSENGRQQIEDRVWQMDRQGAQWVRIVEWRPTSVFAGKVEWKGVTLGEDDQYGRLWIWDFGSGEWKRGD
ncbi:hypothetical protein BJ508DRAFT_331134 [Ascobolus immersus RN42]|uniref:Uncharacterized protein n=1 Tax=Ascobolus immersus RN42 TaxID=1160509 RepID=A0A3N4HT47_ASCIM|nr:hypothetical protein BJ508DRAFT_331134 [Ascobolus immersus RN42]